MNIKNLVISAGIVLSMFATAASALPTIYFNGDVSYDSDISEMSISSEQTFIAGISSTPNLLGASLDFSGLLTSLDTSLTDVTLAYFSSSDLSYIDGDGNTLLTAEFNDLRVSGGSGLDFGVLRGTLTATGGSLMSDFGLGTLFALELNLSTTFSNALFDSDFTGDITGRIEGEAVLNTSTSANVAEPSIMAILGSGLLIMALVRRRMS